MNMSRPFHVSLLTIFLIVPSVVFLLGSRPLHPPSLVSCLAVVSARHPCTPFSIYWYLVGSCACSSVHCTMGRSTYWPVHCITARGTHWLVPCTTARSIYFPVPCTVAPQPACTYWPVHSTTVRSTCWLVHCTGGSCTT